MTGGLQLQDAMYKAHAMLSANPVVDPSGNKDFVSRQIINDRVGEALDKITEDTTGSLRGWTNWVFGTRTLTPEQQAVVDKNRDAVSARIEAKAKMAKQLNPQITESVAIQGAIDDTAREGVHIGGEIIFDQQPDTRKGLSELMGFNGDKVAPNDALNYYITKHYNALLAGPVGQAAIANNAETWYQTVGRVASGANDVRKGLIRLDTGSDIGTQNDLGYLVSGAKKLSGPPDLPYYTKVDMRSGLIQISFYKPSTGETLLTRVVQLPAMGQEYKNDKLNQPTVFGEVSKKIRNTLSPLDKNTPPEMVPELGTPIN